MADKRTPSLDGLIQTKGATRPDGLESPARALQASLATGIHTPPLASPAEREPRAKSLTLRLSEPLMVDPYHENRATGAFILVDEATNDTVAAAMVVGA